MDKKRSKKLLQTECVTANTNQSRKIKTRKTNKKAIKKQQKKTIHTNISKQTKKRIELFRNLFEHNSIVICYITFKFNGNIQQKACSTSRESEKE